MALPAYVTASTGSTDAGGPWAHTLATPGAAGRLLIVQVIQGGTSASNAITVTSVTNAENLAGTDNVLTAFNGGVGLHVGTSGSPTGYQYLFFGRSLSTSAPVITGGNSGTDDIYIRAYEFNTAHAGTTLGEIIENVTPGAFLNNGSATATVSAPNVTTMGPNRKCLCFVACDNDNAIGPFTGESGGDWAEIVAEYASNTGTDGMLQLQHVDLTAQGSMTGGTVDITGSPTGKTGCIAFALRGSAEARVYAKVGKGVESAVA